MRHGARWLALVALALLAACGGGRRGPELVVVSVWSGVDPGQLSLFGAPYVTTPEMNRLVNGGFRMAVWGEDELDATPVLASLLTGVPQPQHGLISIHEVGRERIFDDVPTLAEKARDAGWFTLGSVGSAKATLGGLARGFEVWRAPEIDDGTRAADEVLDAIEADLARALEEHERVFLLLSFDDFLGEDWLHSTEHDAFLEERMAPFRGRGGAVDDAYAAQDEEADVVRRLQRRLYRQGAGEAREALEASLYGARLARVDAALGRVREVSEGASARWAFFARKMRVNAPAVAGVFPLPELQLGEAPPTQKVRVESRVARQLDVELDAPAVETEASGAARERDAVVSFELPGEVTYTPASRGAGARLVLQGAACASGRVWLGARRFEETDLCELHPRSAPDWPEAANEPALDVRSLGGRRERVVVGGQGEVELVLEQHPPQAGFLEHFTRLELDASEHPLRPGAVVVRGEAPLEFDLPDRVPSVRLGVALRLEGARVPGERIRYRGRVFRLSGRLELLLSPGVWLDPRLRGGAPESEEVWAAIELLDELPAKTSTYRLTPAEREYLARSDDR